MQNKIVGAIMIVIMIRAFSYCLIVYANVY